LLVSTLKVSGEAFGLALILGIKQTRPSRGPGKYQHPQSRLQRRFSLRRKRLDVIDFEWSGREDLNLRPPGPEPGLETFFEFRVG